MISLEGFLANPQALVVFDLDNTLIDERSYLFQAYEVLSIFLAEETGVSQSELCNRLVDSFETKGRQNIFQFVFAEFGIPDTYLEPSLEILRSAAIARPLEIADWAADLLPHAASFLAILTNGNPRQQKNKILHSNISKFTTRAFIVYANDFEPKPSPLGLQFIMREIGSDGDRTLMVGDSEVDAECARRAGVFFHRATYQEPGLRQRG